MARIENDHTRGWKVAWREVSTRTASGSISRSKMIHNHGDALRFKELVESDEIDSYPSPTVLREAGLTHLAFDVNPNFVLLLYDIVHGTVCDDDAERIKMLKIAFEEF